jgi:formylmethanofuran dehydrogenase subunit C
MLLIRIKAAGESCLCDFTYDFYWQHKGSRLDPEKILSGHSMRQLVEGLKKGETICIDGDVGNRLGSSLGVDLVKFGGAGGPINNIGRIIVDGDAGSRLGISMLRGTIYISGNIEEPVGNVIEVETDLSGFRKFVSVTEAMEYGISVLEPNSINEEYLIICDGVLRDTLAARNTICRTVQVDGEVGMSTGILMSSGSIEICGDANRNTGVLMKGGRIIIEGRAGDFTGVEMHGGEIFIAGSAGSYTCARMKGGVVYARDGKPVPPAKAQALDHAELVKLAKVLDLNPMIAMIYRKFSL